MAIATVQPLPAGSAQIQPALALAIVAALFVAVALVLRQISAVMPRLTLPAALRWCWARALPLALVGLVYMALVPG